MDFDITTVRKLTGLRNKEQDFALKQRLTNLLNTAENINKATHPLLRDELIGSFAVQWAEYTVERDTAGGSGG